MSLQTRIQSLIQAIGADVKDLLARVQELEEPTPIDAGGPGTVADNTIDAGVLL